MSVLAIIPAGGAGVRFGVGSLPKQYFKLAGKPIIIHTLEKLDSIDAVDAVAIAVNSDYIDYIKLMITEYDLVKVRYLIEGGSDRQQSVFNVIKSGALAEYDKALVHDSVRPMASSVLFNSVINGLDNYEAVIPGIKARDTIKEQTGNSIFTPDRDKLYAVQTPQGFRADILALAYYHAAEHGIAGTDDACLVEKLISDTGAGFRMKIIEGEEQNIKITTKFDMDIAGMILNI